MKYSPIFSLLLISLIILRAYSVVLGQFANFEVLLQPGAAPGSLGDSYTAIATDPYATYYNPAGVAHAKYKHQFLINTQRFTRFDWIVPFGIKQDPAIFIGRLWKITENLGVAVTYSTFGLYFTNSASKFKSNSLNLALGMRVGKKLSVGLGISRYNSESNIAEGSVLRAEMNSMAYSFGFMLQNLNIHRVVGNDTSGTAFGISFSGISDGVKSNQESNYTFFGGNATPETRSYPYPATARVGASTIIVNTDYMIISTSLDIRKVFKKLNDDGFDNWLTPYITGRDAEDATYHTGLELKFPGQHIAFRMGKSIEEQENPKAERINYGIRLWYRSIEFISTIGYSKVYVFTDEGPFESHRTSFELRFGIK